jgi:hypothetical protein
MVTNAKAPRNSPGPACPDPPRKVADWRHSSNHSGSSLSGGRVPRTDTPSSQASDNVGKRRADRRTSLPVAPSTTTHEKGLGGGAPVVTTTLRPRVRGCEAADFLMFPRERARWIGRGHGASVVSSTATCPSPSRSGWKPGRLPPTTAAATTHRPTGRMSFRLHHARSRSSGRRRLAAYSGWCRARDGIDRPSANVRP